MCNECNQSWFYIPWRNKWPVNGFVFYILVWSSSTKPVASTIQTTSEFYSHVYKMNYPNRGKAIIINNKTFNPNTGLNERNGTDQDASALCCRLSELDFDVDLHHNLKAEEIKNILKKGRLRLHAFETFYNICLVSMDCFM